MKKILLILLAYNFLPTAFCQTWQWAKRMDGNGASLCLDSLGNSYLTGQLWFPYGIFGNDTLQVQGPVNDVFVAKVDSDGNFIWAKRAGGNEPFATGGERGGDILFEKSTNSIIFNGRFDSPAPTIGSCTLGGTSSQSFLSKLDTNGNCIWAQTIMAPNGAGRMTLDDNGNIYMVGYLNQAAGFNTIPLQVIPPGGFLAKFSSSNGDCIWVKNITEQGSGAGDIRFYNNQLYLIGGSTNDTLLLDTATAYCYPTDIFISEFDTAGNVQWVKTMGGPNYDTGIGLSLDGSGNIYVTGQFKDTIYFDTLVLTNGSNKDWFLAKYDNGGNFIWAQQSQATGSNTYGSSTSSDINGNTYTAGRFSGTATFGTYTVTAATANDLFVARYDSSGTCLGVVQADNYDVGDIGGDVITDKLGGFHIAGRFLGSTTFGSYSLSPTGLFVAKHDALTGIENAKMAIPNNTLLIYANPNQGTCNITVPDELLHEQNLVLTIYDNNGKLIQQKQVQIEQEKIKVNIEAEAKGVYNVTLGNKTKLYSGKIVFE